MQTLTVVTVAVALLGLASAYPRKRTFNNGGYNGAANTASQYGGYNHMGGGGGGGGMGGGSGMSGGHKMGKQLTHKAPPLICSIQQFHISCFFLKNNK